MENHDNLKLLPDAELIRLFTEGVRAAFDVIMDRYRNVLFNYLCRYRLFSDEQRWDIIQDAFMTVFLKIDLGQYEERGMFKAFLYSITKNLACDIIEQHKKEEAFEMEWRLHHKVFRSPSFFGASPGQLRDAMKQLTAKQRLVITLYFFDGKTEKEIAEILHIAVGTVKATKNQAIEKLRKILRSRVDPLMN